MVITCEEETMLLRQIRSVQVGTYLSSIIQFLFRTEIFEKTNKEFF